MSALRNKIYKAEKLLDELYVNQDFLEVAFTENIDPNDLQLHKNIATQRRDEANAELLKNNNDKEKQAEVEFYNEILKLIDDQEKVLEPKPIQQIPPSIHRPRRPVPSFRNIAMTPERSLSRSRSPVRRPSPTGTRRYRRRVQSGSPTGSRRRAQSGSPTGVRNNNARFGGKKTFKRSKHKRSKHKRSKHRKL